MSNNDLYRSPSYQVAQRFVKNKAALVGLVIIVLAHIVATFAFLIMPDATPNANDGSALIKRKPAGFEVLMLKQKKNFTIETENFFHRLLYGQESGYSILPLEEYRLRQWDVCFTAYGQRAETCQPLANVLAGFLNQPGTEDKNVIFKTNKLYFINNNKKLEALSQAQVQQLFHRYCLEKRFYIFGTDRAGRDVFSRLLFGTRISLAIGFIAVFVSLFIGILVGSVGGYFGGVADKAALWLMTVVWSIPGIMLVIAISLAAQSKGVWVVFVAVGLTMWVEAARVVRGQIMVLKQQLYIEAAKALGISNYRIILKHIMPNMMGPVIVIATANFASAILIEAGLSFLGLGVQPPMPSWGMMVSEGYNSNWEGNGWQLVLLPSLCICVLVLAFNLFGNGLRDAYDSQTSIKW